MIFSEPSVVVTYLNALDEKLQEIVLESGNTIIVREYLYDELGRQTITAQPARVERFSNQSLLAYYSDFVTNSDPYSANSVWKTGELQVDTSKVIGEYDYSQIKYENNPLNEEFALGLPGKEFSVLGPYARRFLSSSENSFINDLFPSSKNYSYRVEHKPGDVEDISVFDSKNNRVAWYIHVPGSKDLLSTYKYDENDRLVMILPPLYHEEVCTLRKSNSQLQSISKRERVLQESLGTHISYNEKGNIIAKTTPDSGKVEYLHDNNGLLKFAVHYSNFNNAEVENIIYFNYDQLARLSSIGKLTSLPPKEELLTLALTDNNTQEYQRFDHGDFEREPILRGNLKRTITFNDGEPFIEELILDTDKRIISKRIVIPVNDLLLVATNKEYVAGKLTIIEYPIDFQGQRLKLTYQYNKLGEVVEIGVPGKPNLFASFIYNSAGQVINEQHLPGSAKNFTRQYSYNSSGFLTHLKDKFLTEEVYYTDGSYGGHGYGDGTVTHTKFKATWHEDCDNSKLGLNEQSFISEDITDEESALCFRKLKEANYLDDHDHQAKAYYPNLEHKLPIVCSYGITGCQIQNTLGKKGFPAEYGYSYDYGNHQELTKAKYFVGSEVSTPLQPDTFAKEISGINDTASHDIWKILERSRYLIGDNEKVDLSLRHAKKGKHFIRKTLSNDLKSIKRSHIGYRLPLESLLISCFSQKQNLSVLKSKLRGAFIQWDGEVRTERVERATNEIIKMLEEKQYLQNPLSRRFKNKLRKYESFIPDIVRVLSEHFAKQLGKAEFDVESYDIDANGNHKHYYTGFDRYELSYRNNTNQVNNMEFNSYASSQLKQIFPIKHDSRGNVIQALHKGIEQIDYNPVSNRATKIQLTDGKTLTFYYDAQGERVLKRVANSQGQTTKEIHYIRDEFGRAFVEREITYIAQDLPPDVLVTTYIYGPRGLLGFIRRDQFYSVITDHEGSIRLVVREDEVVAAYDYLPYGNLMREYGSDPEAHIPYRYTGQEWDEETGLYNYHARFYDPSISRFYQIDPKEQYFSPYKYAGNSPVSMVDPDGELALLITAIILGITGAYLGGAGMNGDWNPGNWEWDSGKTWLGIVGGGIGGAVLPVGFVGSVGVIGYGATIGLGAGGTYLGMAAANNEWDLSKWDYSSPATWSGGFQGFGIGAGTVGGLSSAKAFYQGLSSIWGKGAFIAGSTGTGAGLFVMNGFAANWDFSKPGVYYGLVDAVAGAPDLPMFMRSAGKFSVKYGKQMVKGIRGDQSELAFVAAGKMGLKVGGMGAGVSFYGLLSMLDKGRLNADNFDIFTVLTGMLTTNQFYSIGRNAYRTRKLHREAEMVKKAERISEQIAEETVNEYKRIINLPEGEKVIDNSIPYTKETKALLGAGSIPNRAIAIAMTDNVAVAAFSTNSAPGLITVYTHDKLGSLMVKSNKFLKDNRLIGDREVTLSDNAELNQRLMNDIENTQRVIKENNVREFENQITEGSLSELLDKLPNDVKSSIIEDLREAMDENGHLVKSFIDSRIRKHVIEQDPVIKRISDDLKIKKGERETKKKKVEELPKEAIEEKKKLGLEIANIGKRIRELDRLSQEKKKSISAKMQEEQLTEKFWEHVKDFKMRLIPWEPINCAEPHAITALSRVDESFPLISRLDEVNSYGKPRDIRFLATYKLPELTPFPSCDHCVITTRQVKNVITDPGWIEGFSGKISSADAKFDASKKRTYFLMPYHDMTSRLVKPKNSNSTRKARSVFDEWVGIKVASKYENDTSTSIADQSNKHIDKSRKVASSATKPASFINDFFGRVKGFIGGFLPGKSGETPTCNLPKESISTAESKTTLLEMGLSQIDRNGTILLLDTFIRRVTGQKYISSNVVSIPEQEARSYAFSITSKLKKIVEQAALKSGISMHRLNIDFMGMQKEITGKIIGGKFGEISGVLNSYIEKACPGKEVGCPGRLSPKKFDKFVTIFNDKLDIALNQSIQQILHSEHNTLEVNSIKEQQKNLENERPKSYLNDTFVQGHLTQAKVKY